MERKHWKSFELSTVQFVHATCLGTFRLEAPPSRSTHVGEIEQYTAECCLTFCSSICFGLGRIGLFTQTIPLERSLQLGLRGYLGLCKPNVELDLTAATLADSS